jgi:hypothetical protein
MSIIAIVLLSLVHVFVGRLHFLDREEGSAWLSFSGGAAIAYVFVYVLPKLGYGQIALASATAERGFLDYLQHHVYLVALAGFTLYFGVALVAERLKESPPDPAGTEAHVHPLEIIHIASFAAYSLLVGYLVADAPWPGIAPILLTTVAIVLHFVESDHALCERYGRLYLRWIRWLLVAAVLAGWIIGVLTSVSAATVALWFALLAGSIIVNVIEEELPGEQHGRFWPFLGGVAVFTALILLIERFSKLD